MQQWLSLFPSPLLLVTICFVILPTFLAIFLRFTLYEHLLNSTKKVQQLIRSGQTPIKEGEEYTIRLPQIVDKLISRFSQASIDLEQVNTSALIDSLYSQETINFFGIKIGCENIDYFCRVLPNLLLSLGLLGTFLGITINLYSLSQTINQIDGNNVSSLVGELKEPLRGMGIAFMTSLIAITCSSLLTISKFKWNTNIVKYQFISALEDYLDNIYFPALPTHTRMDKAVDRLVVNFNSFLNRFGDTVRQAVETSLGEQISEIKKVNEKSAKLAEQVYSELLKTSSSLNSSAIKFETAANTIENSDFADKLVRTTTNLDKTYNNFAQSTSFLEESTKLMKTSLEDFTVSVEAMMVLGEEVKNLNIQCNDIFELNHKQIASEKTALNNIQLSINNLVKNLNNNQEEIHNDLKRLGENLVKNITEEMGENNQKIEIISQTMNGYISKLNDIQLGLNQLVASLKEYQVNVNTQLQNLDNNLGENNQKVETVNKTMKDSVSNLSQIKLELNQLVLTLKGYQGSLNTELQNLGDRLLLTVDKSIGNNNSKLAHLEQLNDYLNQLKNTQSLTNNLLEKFTDFDVSNFNNYKQKRNKKSFFRQSTNEPTIRPFKDTSE